MAVIERNQVKAPVLRKQTVEVPALGGAVIVRGMYLSEVMETRELVRASNSPADGEKPEQVAARVGALACAHTLAKTVGLADGRPLWSFQEWEVFGAQHVSDVLRLFDVARSLSGLDSELVEKN